MAGLFERIKPGGLDGQGNDRINVHLVVAGIKGYGSGSWTRVEVLNALNNVLVAQPNGTALTVAEQNDLTAIADQVDANATTLLKIVYVVGKLEPSMIAAEAGSINETKWRTDLGI